MQVIENLSKGQDLKEIRRKSVLVSVIIIFFFSVNANYSFSQSENHKVYLGGGFGLDYGGFGAKFEYLPIRHFGIFGGAGYNLLSFGWNVGGTVKILPNKRVSPNLMVFYGYNAVVRVIGAPHLNMTSYGVSFGVNLDIKLNSSGKLKLTPGLFVPIRSSEYKDRIKNPNLQLILKPLPIAISIGFNVRLN